MTLATALALLTVFVAAPLSWYVVILVWRLSREAPTVPALRAQAWASVALAGIVTVFAVVFVNNDLEVPPLDAEATRILTRGSLLLLSVGASLYWLRKVWRS